MKTDIKIKRICVAAVFTALVFIITRFIQIPIPLGYFNIGNSIILLACLLIPMPYGVAVGSLGSALADLTSFPVYALPTLIIKALMPMVFYAIYRSRIKNEHVKGMVAAAISTLIPLVGYTATGMILYGGFYAGLAQAPGLIIEYAANLIIYFIFQTLVYPRLRNLRTG